MPWASRQRRPQRPSLAWRQLALLKAGHKMLLMTWRFGLKTSRFSGARLLSQSWISVTSQKTEPSCSLLPTDPGKKAAGSMQGGRHPPSPSVLQFSAPSWWDCTHARGFECSVEANGSWTNRWFISDVLFQLFPGSTAGAFSSVPP